MLFCTPKRENLTRVQGIYCSDEELTRITESLKNMYKGMIPQSLSVLPNVISEIQNMILRDKFVNIVHDVLEE